MNASADNNLLVMFSKVIKYKYWEDHYTLNVCNIMNWIYINYIYIYRYHIYLIVS